MPEIQHIAYIGVTRHGKTEACISRNAPRMLETNRPAFVVFDPPGGLCKKIAQYLAIHGNPFLYDEIQKTEDCPGYGLFPRSEDENQKQKEAKDRQMMSDAIGVIVRAEGKLDASKNQMIQRGLMDALQLYIYQKTDVPFYLLKDCFSGETDAAQFLLQNCSNPEIILRFQYYHALKGQQRQFEVGPAERRLWLMCSCPQFRERCRGTFDLAAFLNGGGVLLLDGHSKDNLSREDCSLIMGTILLLVIALARSGKLTRRVVLVIDEGLNSGLIDLNVGRALREAGKWGLEFQLILQNLAIMETEVREAILQCDILYFFKHIDPVGADFAARICGTMTLDPLKVKEIVTRIRKEHSGEVRIDKIEHTSETKSESGNKTKTKSEGHIAIPIFTDRTEEEIKRMSLDEQITLMTQRLMLLDVGYCIIKDGTNVVFPGQLPMLQFPTHANWPWQISPRITLAERKLSVYLDSLKSHPAFQPLPEFTCTTPKKTRKSGME